MAAWEWVDKTNGIVRVNGNLGRIKQHTLSELLRKFTNSVWGNIKKPQDRKKILTAEFNEFSDELDREHPAFIKHFSNIKVQRHICRHLYKTHVNLRSALDYIGFIKKEISVALHDDLAEKLRLTFEYKDKQIKI